MTGEPSSVIATAPASTISPTSARRSPARPTEMQPTGYTREKPAARPAATTNPTVDGSSIGGSVFGMDQFRCFAKGGNGLTRPPSFRDWIITAPESAANILGGLAGGRQRHILGGSEPKIAALAVYLDSQDPFASTRIGNDEIEAIAIAVFARFCVLDG